ncbi:MAG TPA: protein translocase subunit SecD [Nocardioidaceae bacterium]|nr:protein translocase subunit SecD [Nocardioidaceae bacterium]
MARHAARPGRRLILFALVVLAMFAGLGVAGQWQPKLGLDLQGGTRITLEASTATGQEVTPANLQEARGIIDQRVNGSGVTEANVATQGATNIVVEVPGEKRGDLVDAVKQTAQLRFRLVAAAGAGQPQPAPSANPSAGASPGGKASAAPSGRASAKPGAQQSAEPGGSSSASPRNRALSSGLLAADPTSTPRPKPSATSTPRPGAAPTPAGPTPAPPTAPAVTAKGAPVDSPLAWQDNPGQAWLQRFQKFTCPPADRPAPPVDDVAEQPLLTCDDAGNKLLLSKTLIEGTQLKSAEATPPGQQNLEWTVNLTFDGEARRIFSNVTQRIANQPSQVTQQQKQFAIVLDGIVISAPTVNGVINNGQAEISGSFTQTSAQALANSLRYGALPLKFDVPVVSEQGPTLASDQLSAGLVAGGIGLGLVLIYCMLYYRGLGLVVLASLAFAAAITYAAVLAMSQAIGFTLTLPGIAGLIVAVGITADSFIVYFERIRDEMRGGKSMRVAVETGWVRARATCLAADAVSLLAAVVLYIFSIGVVKGFAFALGISTLIDLVVFFLFTKPMVSWLASFKFFHSGHRLSGLSPDQVGSHRPLPARPTPVGGNA